MEQLKKRMEVKNITKTFFGKKGYFTAIEEVSLDVYDGEFLVILGPGRCGKTVLLNIMSGLEEQTAGSIFYNSKEWKGLNPEIGMVFQKLALMPFKTVIENVELGLKFGGMEKEKRREISRYYIELVGLKGFENYYPKQLSGGMQQRVGIARALAVNPQIIFADEPTGNLDSRTTMEVLKLMQKIVRERNQTLVMVTHDNQLASYADRRIRIIDGKIVSIEEGAVEIDKRQQEEEQGV